MLTTPRACKKRDFVFSNPPEAGGSGHEGHPRANWVAPRCDEPTADTVNFGIGRTAAAQVGGEGGKKEGGVVYRTFTIYLSREAISFFKYISY